MKPIIRKKYDQIKRKGYKCTGELITKQSPKQECDINWKLRNYTPQQIANALVAFELNNMVNVGSQDFQESMEIVIAGQTAFDNLPAEIRKSFDNDAAQFLAYAEKAENHDSLIKMGLINDDRVKPDPNKKTSSSDKPEE